MTTDSRSREELIAEIERLRYRLEEAEEVLNAVKFGTVDAVVVSMPKGKQVFTLEGADHPYRVIVETMSEGAAILNLDSTILYCNTRLATMLQIPLENLIGTKLSSYVAAANRPVYADMLEKCALASEKEEISMITESGDQISVLLSCNAVDLYGNQSFSIVITDLTDIKQLEIQLQLFAELELSAVALRESEEKFRMLADNMPQLCWMANADGWRTWYNKRWYEYTGTTPEQMEGWGWQAAHDPKMLPQVLKLWQEAIATGKPFEMEFPLLGSNGIYRPFLTRVMPIFDDEGNVDRWFGTNTDITARKAAEMALYDSERREHERAEELATLLDAAPTPILIAHDPDCIHLTGNRAADKLLRISRGAEASLSAPYEIKPHHYKAVKDGRELRLDEMPAQRAARGILVQDFEFSLVFDDGTTRQLLGYGTPLRDEKGQPRGAVHVLVDITERKLAEEQLRESQERLALAADAGQIGMFDFNMVTGDLHWTQQQELIFGYEPTTTTTTTTHTYNDWADRLHPDDLPMVEEQMRQAMEEKAPFHSEYRLVWPDGSIHWVHVASNYYFDDSGRCIRLMGAVRDITRKKQLEESLQQHNDLLETRVAERTAELREKDRMLIQQSRLAAMGEMINNIAHQWRQPLNVLGLNIQSLPLYLEMGELTKESLDKSTKDAMNLIKHMSRTIDDFRNFFKPDKEKTDFSVNQSIQQTIALVEDSFHLNQIKLVTRTSGDALINGFPNEFSQVILNILQNARDALMERTVHDGSVAINTTSENGRVVITITDNAGGIPEEIINRIFEPYFSTKGVQGTGIGLFMSKNIIENNMGGSITARNTVQGAEFRIEV